MLLQEKKRKKKKEKRKKSKSSSNNNLTEIRSYVSLFLSLLSVVCFLSLSYFFASPLTKKRRVETISDILERDKTQSNNFFINFPYYIYSICFGAAVVCSFVVVGKEETRERKMLVANSFDLWQKDTFFSAAEEVQQSTDTMESAYRAWLRARKEGFIPQHLDKLNRELQMALGTAKWQLEEFERAVCLSYRNNGDDITITRHREFVSAIEDQISHVETALKESLKVEGKKPFRWVNLDKEESDDLAHFLSGTPGTSRIIKDDHIKVGAPVISSPYKSNIIEDYSIGSEEVSAGVKDISCGFIELQEKKVPETVDEISYRADQISSNLRDRNALEIVVDTNNRETNELTEATLKEKGSKPFIWRERGEIYRRAKEVQSHAQMKLINWINNHLRGRQRNQRQHVSPMLPVKSIRFVLALMLTIFLFVPFVLHST